MKSISHRVSHAAWLPTTSAPPHDPKRLPLNHRAGWRLASTHQVQANACGQLMLRQRTGALRLLTEASGSFGGLVLPKHLAFSADGGLVLLDKARALLKKFDPCGCRFTAIPCTGGIGRGSREFRDPAALAICGDNLLVADTGNHRVVVYSLLGFLVRGIWTPPADVTEQAWQPIAIAITNDRKVLVADPANGCVHVFNFAGRWLRALVGVGAVQAIAVDTSNQLYVQRGEDLPLLVYDLSNNELAATLTPTALADDASLYSRFAALPLVINAQGHVELSALCDRYKSGESEKGPRVFWFDQAGQLLNVDATVIPEKKFLPEGTLYSQAIDSQLYRCQWDSIRLQLHLPAGTRVCVSTFTAESVLTDKQIAGLDDNQWLTRQWIFPKEDSQASMALDRALDGALDWDCLIRSEGGRYLWLKIVMLGDGFSTPCIGAMELNFPRISLRRYLPAVFGEEKNTADFTDRFLSVFDRGFRQIETHIDTFAHRLDPLSAPAQAGSKDFLSWLASWIGVSLDRQLPLSLRRQLVKQAGSLFACRGTRAGLKKMLEIYVGFPQKNCGHADADPCDPCDKQAQWQPPQLILEHYTLRRWLIVGAGRLGDQAQLWGQKIVNRTQLRGRATDGNAQLGVTQLNTRQDPLRDPFHVYAHKFSVFLPGWVARKAHLGKAIARLINGEKPAHTQHNIIYVEPRFRVGIQSMIGYDSVIGCYPQGVTLGQSQLGKASVLTEQDNTDSTLRIGSKASLGITTRLK